MNDGPSREEFKAFVARVYEQIDDGFSGVHERLDVLNGRTRTNSENIVNLDTRMKSAEHLIARRRHDEEEDAAVAEGRRHRNTREGTGEVWAEDAASTVTKREKMLMAFGLAALSIVLTVLQFVGTKLWELLTVHKP